MSFFVVRGNDDGKSVNGILARGRNGALPQSRAASKNT